MRAHRFHFFVTLFSVLFLTSCMTTAALQQARDALRMGDYQSAYMHYQAVLAENPNHEEAQVQLQSISQQITQQAIQQAQNSIAESETPSVPAIESAIARLKQAEPFDRTGILPAAEQEFLNQIQQIRSENQKMAERARSAMSQGNFDEAKNLLERIQTQDPNSELAMRLKNEFNQSRLAYLEAQMDTHLKDKKLSQARTAYEQVLTLDVASSEKDRITKKFKEREIEIIRKQIKDDLKDKKFYTTYLNIMEGGYEQEMADVVAKIREEGGRFYLSQAQKRFEKGEFSRAYLEAVKGYELAPNLEGMFEIHRDARDKVMEATQQYIAVPAFGAPQNNPDLGPQFSDALISYLFRILPYGINIVEREKIDMLMEEQKREFKEVGDILNVGMIITGNVSLLNIDRQNTESKATVRAQVGTKTEVNPEYEMLARIHGTELKRVKNLPPATISVPQYENFQYTKGRTTIKGFANVSARIFDTHKGGIIYAEEFNANYEIADDYQDGVEIAGIQTDPLELPTDTEVAEKLRTKIVQQIANVIQGQFANREHMFLEEAEYFLARKEVEKAMEPLAQGFLYCVKSKVSPKDPDFLELRDLILAHTEKDFLWW